MLIHIQDSLRNTHDDHVLFGRTEGIFGVDMLGMLLEFSVIVPINHEIQTMLPQFEQPNLSCNINACTIGHTAFSIWYLRIIPSTAKCKYSLLTFHSPGK